MGKRIAIVGNGAAAAECLLSLRKHGYTGAIDLYAAGELPVYNPMLTSYYAAGKIPYAMMFPYGNDFSLFETHGATLHKNTPIARVNAASRALVSQAGEVFSFDQCLIATGAKAFVPPFPGAEGPRVFTLRTVADAVRLHAALAEKPKSALVVGASMVGIKLVELFERAGVQCCLADMAPHIFPLAAGKECARFIEGRLRKRGIRLRFSAAIERAEERPGGGVRASFKDSDEPEEADILLVCVGVRANTALVDPDEIDVQQGILVDERMRTSAPGVFAAGDVAQGYNLLTGQKQVIGLWANARSQGRTAGANIAGVHKEYRGEVLHNITRFCGMDFVGMGEVHEYDYSRKAVSDCHWAQLFYRDGRLCGANFLDKFEDCGVLKHLLVKSLAGAAREGAAEAGGLSLQKHLFENILAQVQG